MLIGTMARQTGVSAGLAPVPLSADLPAVLRREREVFRVLGAAGQAQRLCGEPAPVALGVVLGASRAILGGFLRRFLCVAGRAHLVGAAGGRGHRSSFAWGRRRGRGFVSPGARGRGARAPPGPPGHRRAGRRAPCRKLR
ncbi:hypothetical protein GCM10010289_45500 [Streptomyces violascens]|uniref:Uncharacterized protein n=1 Tax=Streptomyces violascens TaxID=67381 RepID=A0ABQ3QXY1_9ACTN|nr:hypothetical protein GCM10010289_45500 [Streptomyces violascens]GHI42142.1 hypothetical protein Sviol_65500 [Streptomyces violascens]